MQKLLREYLDEQNKRHKKNRRTGIAVLVLVVVVFGSVMGILTQYGVAMTGRPQCGMEEHTHTDECYEKTLVCGLEETEGHTHTEECLYPAELTCGLEESESHTHDESCYTVPEGYACGLEEGEGHTHTDECYEEKLVCGKEEHVHTDACYLDAKAEEEDPAAWDSQYAETEWKGAWGEDLATAAQMQIGYQESTDNYTAAEDGSHKGYTRYGHFAGDMYADWDVAFVNFCLHYAGLEESGMFPAETAASEWYEKFVTTDNGAYSAYVAEPQNYIPAAGDIVFFQKENEETSVQMGIVSSVNEENRTIAVVEGNNGNEVKETEYSLDDAAIVRYITVSAMEAAYKNQADSQAQAEENGENTEEEADGSIVSPDETQLATTENGTRTLSAAGADYTVTVSFTEEAQIPDNAVLDVREIAPDTEEYQQYYEQSLAEMGVGSLSFARCFDITFLVDGTEIEPAAPVDVKIIYDQAIGNSENEIRRVVHFAEDGTEVIGSDVDEEENSVSFTQNSFSVIVDASANKNVYVEELESDINVSTIDGQSFYVACKDGGTAYFLGNESKNIKAATDSKGALDGLEASRTLWKFEQVPRGGNEFYISAESKYLKIESYMNGEASLKTVDEKEDASVFEVNSNVRSTMANSQKVGITIKCQLNDGIGYYINLSGARTDAKIFAGWKEDDDNSILTLYQKFTPTSVDSISTKNLITMKMQDYSNYTSASDCTTFSPFVLTNDNPKQSNTESGLRQGILSNILEESGYPTFLQGYDYEVSQRFKSLQGQNLGKYFDSAQDVDGLFQKDGDYYEYDSNKNAAVLDRTTGNFTLYEELVTSYYDNKNSTYRRGNFLPYDTFENGILSNNPTEDGKNLFLPDSGGEEWYQRGQGTANYHFGMEMETTFYQMKDGKVGENNDHMVYTFKGDDDLWVYIDGVLVLDIGGCHGSIEGTIDFATGIVTINTEGCGDTNFITSGLYEQKTATEYTTTLAKCFRAAYGDTYNFNTSEWKSIGDDNWIFADYTKHTFNMWYMERGSAVSNLKLKFNLAMIKTGEVHITKNLAGSEQEKYANENFGFQVFVQPIIGEVGLDGNDTFDDEAALSTYRPLCQQLKNLQRTNVTAYVQTADGKKYPYSNTPDKDGHYYVKTDKIPENNLPTIKTPLADNGAGFDNNNVEEAVFYLKPGETLILEGLKVNRQYYVREVGVDTTKYVQTSVNGNPIVNENTQEDLAKINGLKKENNGIREIQSPLYRVDTNAAVVFTNHCIEVNRSWEIYKISENKAQDGTENYLSGAIFTLTAKPDATNGTVEDVSGAQTPTPDPTPNPTPAYYGKSGVDGKIVWYGNEEDMNNSTGKSVSIPAGEYILEETQAPIGFTISDVTWVVSIEGNNNVTIKENSEDGKEIANTGDSTPREGEAGALVQTLKFELTNKTLYELPSTGGSGIFWYMFSGVLLMAGAALFLYKNKVQGGAGKLE